MKIFDPVQYWSPLTIFGYTLTEFGIPTHFQFYDLLVFYVLLYGENSNRTPETENVFAFEIPSL